MITSTHPTGDSYKSMVPWLAALFLVVLGAKLWVVQLYGSPLPLWDQWYEAELFFRPWLEGHLTWKDFFAPYCEHRIFFTRLLDLSVIKLNGRWEPLLQMTVNAFIFATYACGLACCLWEVQGRKSGWLICFLLAPFFALPYASENTIWAFNSQAYLLAIFSLATLAGLGFGKPGSGWWWFGLITAVLGLFTMASGLLAPAAIAGLAVLRAIKRRRMDRGNVVALGSCLAVTVLGAFLTVSYEGDRLLRAHNFAEFSSALARNLAWPFFSAPETAGLIILPLALLAVLYFRPSFAESRPAEFLLVLGLWSGLQSIALAYGRGNFGEAVPASRYMDKLNVLVIASLFAVVLLSRSSSHARFSTWAGRLLPLIFAAVIFSGLCRVSQIVMVDLLVPTRMMTLVAEERVETFMATGNEQEMLESPTVRPSPEVALLTLRDPKFRAILPAICLPPADAHLTGRFSAVSQWLLRNSTGILYCGLGLFAGLMGCALVRSPLGLAWDNLPAGIAFLALLAALGFVWSMAPVKRETIERDLDARLTAYFKSVGNHKRAAIFEHKAGMPKNQ